MPELSTGTIVDGRYKILSRLGAGGMADVFLAEDQQLGRKVALKLLHRRFAEDPDFVERFRREAQSAAGLQHPNVVSVYDRGAYDGTYYIAMEYLPGRSLKQLIRQEAPLDPVRAIEITVQILKAARFAHRRGVIHRDLKPHNVIVDDSGHAKVTDFGIARAGASDMTETGSIMGTAQYLSPEQAQGHSVGAQSDLYSVGVVLYELLTGRVPFEAESAVTIALKHVSEAPTPPSAYNPNVPPELEQVVMWSLNKNPDDRPADADQLITVLERVKESIVSGARGQRTASMPAVAAVGYVDVPTTPAPALGQTGSFVAAPAMWADNGGGYPPQVPPEDEDDRRWWPWVVGLLLILALVGGGIAAYLLTRPTKDTVPRVVGLSVAAAQANIQNAGLQASLQYRPARQRANIVVGQNPDAGVRLNSGSTVTLTVSSGPGNMSVPPVSGLTKATAEKAIKRAGLRIGAEQQESSNNIPAGNATRTDPASGTSLPVGTAVTLYISSGKPKVKVRDVTGETEAQARSDLSNAGFTVQVISQTTTSAQPGTVISQSPVAGTLTTSGSTVTITVAQAPTTVKVPAERGQTLAAATANLISQGLKVSTQTKAVTNQAKDGIVLKLNPPAGSTVKKGSTVVLTVGKFTPPVHTTTTNTTSTPTGTTSTPTNTTTTTTTQTP
jgi:eukaryotic-like serine/threonine-protein kinase